MKLAQHINSKSYERYAHTYACMRYLLERGHERVGVVLEERAGARVLPQRRHRVDRQFEVVQVMLSGKICD